MKNKLTGIDYRNCIATTIAKQMLHDFNLKRQEMMNTKKESFLRNNDEKNDILQNRYITTQAKQPKTVTITTTTINIKLIF